MIRMFTCSWRRRCWHHGTSPASAASAACRLVISLQGENWDTVLTTSTALDVPKRIFAVLYVSVVGLGFSRFEIFNGRDGQEGWTASPCQISSKSLEQRPRYVSFNIMLIRLENAYSRSFWGFWGTFPQIMSLIVLTPKGPSLGGTTSFEP